MSSDAPIELTAQQLLAVASLASGKTITQTAKDLEINEKTIDRWLKLSEFRSALRSASETIYDRSLSEVTALMSEAIAVLRDILYSAESDRDRLAAVKLILDSGHRFKSNQLESRLDALERELGIEQ